MDNSEPSSVAGDNFASKGVASLSINAMFMQRGITLQGLRVLKQAGLKTLLDFDNCTLCLDVSNTELEKMRSFSRAVKLRFATQYRLGYLGSNTQQLGCFFD